MLLLFLNAIGACKLMIVKIESCTVSELVGHSGCTRFLNCISYTNDVSLIMYHSHLFSYLWLSAPWLGAHCSYYFCVYLGYNTM